MNWLARAIRPRGWVRVAAGAACALGIGFACSRVLTGAMPARARPVNGSSIRVLLTAGSSPGRIGSPGPLTFLERDGSRLVARSRPSEQWRVERDGRTVRVVRPDGVPTVWTTGPILVRSES